MARVIVTGGAGYIGSHACKLLQAAGHHPVVFDNFRTGWREAVKFGPYIEGDLLNPADLNAAFREAQPDAVMHFAALCGYAWSDYIQAMRDALAQHGNVRAGIYATTDGKGAI